MDTKLLEFVNGGKKEAENIKDNIELRKLAKEAWNNRV